MNAAGTVLAIASYTWTGARRRWLVFAPAAIFGLLILLQLPRLSHVASLSDDPGQEARAIAAFADLVAAIHANCLVLGAIFAVALGCSATGRRASRHQIAPILARPVSRGQFVLGRVIGLSFVQGLIWLIPAVTIEVLRWSVGAPVRLHPLAYLVPFALHLMLMTAGMAAGSVWRAMPAASVVATGSLCVLLLREGEQSPGSLWRHVGAASRYGVPPLADLLRAASPFLSPETVASQAALLLQSLAWIGIFVALTVLRFETSDFGGRLP